MDIETLDPESHHLLSLLYPNLVRHHVEDPHMGRLKGVYRRTWYANQLLVQSFKLVLQALQEVQVNPLALGEMALVSTCYADYGHRPVYQLDVLVPRSQTLEAIDTLLQIGWTAHGYRPQSGDRLWKPMPFWKDTPVQNAPNIHLNLHNNLFQAAPQSFTDEQLWANAVVTQISDLSVPVLSPVDQLLHLCLKSNKEQQQRPIYWLADAAMLINLMSQEADWVRLVTQAQRYQIILPLRYFLMHLQAVLHLPIPDWVLPSLDKMAISYHELLEYNLMPDNKLLLLKARMVRLRQRWKGLFTSQRASTL
ncbi:nucleotidyltransferase family protein [Merismopedia glauca]|uniref:nucleotidyltransferase family protein n=1 Tax=Merismopedia glauca TaxID=292586 RepID=UPI0030DBBE68